MTAETYEGRSDWAVTLAGTGAGKCAPAHAHAHSFLAASERPKQELSSKELSSVESAFGSLGAEPCTVPLEVALNVGTALRRGRSDAWARDAKEAELLIGDEVLEALTKARLVPAPDGVAAPPADAVKFPSSGLSGQPKSGCRQQRGSGLVSELPAQIAADRVILSCHFMRTELVTTLKRKATKLLADVERTRRPIAITQHGIPSAYLVDVQTWEALEKRMLLLEGIARGERAYEEGRVSTQAQARRRMSRWLK